MGTIPEAVFRRDHIELKKIIPSVALSVIVESPMYHGWTDVI